MREAMDRASAAKATADHAQEIADWTSAGVLAGAFPQGTRCVVLEVDPASGIITVEVEADAATA